VLVFRVLCDGRFSIEANTLGWPTEAETCCEEEKRKHINKLHCDGDSDIVREVVQQDA
jgi:hypothetical protein